MRAMDSDARFYTIVFAVERRRTLHNTGCNGLFHCLTLQVHMYVCSLAVAVATTNTSVYQSRHLQTSDREKLHTIY